MGFNKGCGCDCAGATDPCNCSSIACALTCRRKAGTATLCGFSEYDSPTIPPKKYRKETLSGSFTGCNTGVAGCAAAVGGFEFAYSGAYEVDSATCAETNNQRQKFYGAASFGTCVVGALISDTPTTETLAAGWVPAGSGCAGCTLTQTQASRTWTFGGPTCCGTDIYEGTVQAILSEEDTEQDAETRAADAIGAWDGCSDCTDTTCTAFRTTRGAGDFDFSFRRVETQVSFSATVGQVYKVTIKFYSRILGSGGPFLFYSAEEITLVADNAAETTDWVQVPDPGPGLEAIAGLCTVVLIP